MLERIAADIVKATEASAMEEESLQDTGSFGPKRMHFSVIVTTADLEVLSRNFRLVLPMYCKVHLTELSLRGNRFASSLAAASQGRTVEQERDNLREALALFFETASPAEVKQRLPDEVYVTEMEVAGG